MLRFNDFGYYVGIGGLSAPAIAPLRRLRSGSVLTVRMAVPMVQVGVVRVPVHDGRMSVPVDVRLARRIVRGRARVGGGVARARTARGSSRIPGTDGMPGRTVRLVNSVTARK